MSEPIVCRYSYDRKEFRRLIWSYWRASPLKWLYLLIAVVILVIPLAFSPTVLGKESWPDWLSNFLPALIFVGLMYYATIIKSATLFRKGPFFEKEMEYSFLNEGLHLKNQIIDMELKWEAMGKALENRDGFLLAILGGRSFHWLPKHGFESPATVDAARDIIRAHIPKFQMKGL